MDEWQLRAAVSKDLPALAEVYLRSRTAALPAMPPGVHPPDEVRAWVGGWDLAAWDVWLAQAAEGHVLGYAVVTDDWLHSLYVDPDASGRGVGGALLDMAKQLRPHGFCLWVFESNLPARTFYAHRGLIELDRTDGSANEEKAPDIRMAWPGHDPAEFLRRQLADVEEQLRGLAAQRDALRRALGDGLTGAPGPRRPSGHAQAPRDQSPGRVVRFAGGTKGEDDDRYRCPVGVTVSTVC